MSSCSSSSFALLPANQGHSASAAKALAGLRSAVRRGASLFAALVLPLASHAATQDAAGNTIQAAGLTPSGAWETYILQVAPTVTTASATSLASTSVTLGGEVTSDGSATVSERGIVYSTSNNPPTILDTRITIGTGTGTFSQSVTGLTASTTYYVRAYATNSVGTSYGSAITVTTPPPAPVITANSPSAATYGNAYSFTIAVTGTLPITYNATGLPAGLSVNTTTGVISGTPTETSGSPYTVAISATNAGGTDSRNVTLTVNKRTLLVNGGITASQKTYDGTSSGPLLTVGTVTFSGRYQSDDISVNAAGISGTFADKNVGPNKIVSITGLQPAGAAAANYSISTALLSVRTNIVAKPLTVSGISGTNRVYDGTTTATLTGTAALLPAQATSAGNTSDGKPYDVDSVTLAGTPTVTFDTKNVGTNKALTVTGYTLTGTNAGNYQLTQPTGLTANITTKPLTVTGLAASDKIYNGDTTATLTGTPALLAAEAVGTGSADDGKPYTGDTVAVTGTATGTFASTGPGASIAVTVTGLTASGADAGNYSITQPTGLSATILPPVPTVTSPTSASIASTSATLGGNVTNDGGISITERGIVYAVTASNSNPRIDGANVTKVVASGTSTGVFTTPVTGLSFGTGYSYAAYAINSTGAGYSSVDTFTTTSPVLAFIGTTTALTANPNSSAIDVRDLLHVTDEVTGRTITWSQHTAPARGTLALTNATASSGATDITPGGTITYTPTPGNATADSFVVQATDGTTTVTRTITVTFRGQGTAGAGFVAVGETGTILTSPDGTAWTARTSGTTARLRSVTASANLFVATGESGTVLTSPDGIGWTARSSGVTETLRGVAASPTRFVAVGGDTGTLVRTSADGVTWSAATAPAVGKLRGIAWGGGRFVAVGASGAVVTSPDGISWTQQNASTTERLDGIAWTGTQFSAVSSTGKIYSSADGTSWTSMQATPPSWIESLAWSDTAFVTVGSGGKIKTTANGETWTFRTSGTTNTLHGVTWSGVFANQAADVVAAIANMRKITVAGVTASAKIYDGNASATLDTTSAALSGVASGDTVTLDKTAAAGAFADRHIGTGKAITVTGFAITGTHAGDYTLVQPTGLTADITAKALTVSGITASNKTYDGDANATLTTASAQLVGVVDGETVPLTSGSASGTFDNKHVGTNKTVTIAGFAIGTTGDAANYTLTQPTTTANITAKELTVTGVTANNKTYDGNRTATLNLAHAQLVGVVSGDVVTLATGSGTGTFDTKDVGNGKAVTIASLSIGSAGAANYSLTQPTATANITAKALTVSGVTAANKTYDGNTTATLNTASAQLVGVVNGDTVPLSTGSASGTFDTKNVGTNKSVAVAGLAIGTTGDAANYTLTPPTVTAAVTAKSLTVLGVTASNKVYDGNTTATVNATAATLDGVLQGESVPLSTGSATGAFDTKNVGTNRTVVVAGLSIGSTGDAANYTLTQPTATANITAKSLTVSGVTAADKTYDGNTTATLNTAGAQLAGVIGTENVTLGTGSATGTFDTKNVGANKTVTIAGLSIGSTGDAANYSLTQPSATAAILAKTLTVSGITAANKTYDGNATATLVTTSAQLVGVIGTEQVTLSASGVTGSFDTKHVGANKTVTVAGLSIGTTGDAANYSLTQPSTTASITAKNLTVTGVTASDKTYDGNTTATLNTAGAAPVGVIPGDSVTLATGAATGSFDTKHVGAGKTVTVTGLSIGSTGDAANYSLTQPSTTASITARELTVAGVVANNKTYDGNITATLNTTGAQLVGVVSGDTVNLGAGSATGAFDTKNVGTGKTVTIAGLSIGSTGDAANYSLTQPTTTANITAKALTVSGVAATNKTYDGNTTATLLTTSALPVGVLSGENVTLTTSGATGTFDNKNVGTNKTVTVAGLSIGATGDAANYSLTQPTTTANITAKSLTVTGVTAVNRTYNANTVATLDTMAAALAGVVSGDAVTLNKTGATAAFADKNVGTAKSVTTTGFAIEGIDAGNYSLTQPDSTADITRKALTINGVVASNKVYDATITATLSGTPALGTPTAVGGSTADGNPYTNDAVSVAGTMSGAFADRHAGSAKIVTVSGLTLDGGDAGNYLISALTASANITAKPLAISGVTATDRVYDATNIAPITGTPVLATALAAGTGSATDGAPYMGDVVSVAGSPAGTFANNVVAAGKAVTVTGLTLTGDDAANYTPTQPVGLTATVAVKTLTVIGLAADARVYNGTTVAPLSGTAALPAAIAPGTGTTVDGAPFAQDDVGLAGAASGAFADRHVGTAKPVTVSGLSLSGAQAANYQLQHPTTLTADVTPKTLASSGLTAVARTYDGTTVAPLSGAAVLGTAQAPGAGTSTDGLPYTGDTLSITGTAAGAFADRHVGTGKTVAISGLALSGAESANYALAMPVGVSGSVTPKALSVQGLAGATKVYDATTSGPLTGAAALLAAQAPGAGTATDGKPYTGDTVEIAGTAAATFADKLVGANKPLTVTGLTLAGAHATNYSVTQPATLTATITAKELTVTGVVAAPRPFNGTTTAVLDLSAVQLAGIAGSDTVTLVTSGAMGVYASSGAGGSIPVAVSGLAITGADAGNYALTQPSVTGSIIKASASVALSNLAQAYNGSVRSAAVTTSPSGLNVVVSYNGSVNAPTDAGSYAVSATINDPNHEGSATGTLTVSKATQTVTITAAGGSLSVGTPVAISASASSGLPVTLSIVSGSGTLGGSSLTLTSTAPVVVRATQAGNANFEPATAERTFTATAATKQPQTIAFAPLANKKTTDTAFGVSATASSGLPVSFAIVGGPALISGSTITLTGASGAVTVRASQAGDAGFEAAPDVIQSFNVIGADAHQVFFGITENNDTVAVDIAPDGTSGTLLCYIGATGEAFIVTFTINPDGTFDAIVTSLNAAPVGASANDSGPARAAATPPRTFRGRLTGNTITGSILELGLNFTTTLQPRTGPTAPISGLYQSSAVNSAGGRTASIVGTEGQVLVIASTATISTGGTGRVANDGTFTVDAVGATIAGAVDAPTTTVSGTILIPNQPVVPFSGIASTTVRTDRLINLSSRARIGPAAGRTLITGFVIGGADAKRVLLRAVGPTLAGFGVSGAIPNPRLQLYNGQGALLLENDDWSGADTATAFGQVGAFTLSNGARDAALLTTLAPGAYTMHVIDGGDTGVALAEIYDASANPQGEYQRLINISSRGTVEAGDGVLIGGFVVTGNAPKRVLVRGVGPALTGFGLTGTLADPRLAIYSGGTVIASNNDWSTPTPINTTQVVASGAEIAEAARGTGAFAFSANSRDAAVVITLAPGAYTAQVSAADGGTGVALVEIYELPE